MYTVIIYKNKGIFYIKKQNYNGKSYKIDKILFLFTDIITIFTENNIYKKIIEDGFIYNISIFPNTKSMNFLLKNNKNKIISEEKLNYIYPSTTSMEFEINESIKDLCLNIFDCKIKIKKDILFIKSKYNHSLEVILNKKFSGKIILEKNKFIIIIDGKRTILSLKDF